LTIIKIIALKLTLSCADQGKPGNLVCVSRLHIKKTTFLSHDHFDKAWKLSAVLAGVCVMLMVLSGGWTISMMKCSTSKEKSKNSSFFNVDGDQIVMMGINCNHYHDEVYLLLD
jgi:hypothetical protein